MRALLVILPLLVGGCDEDPPPKEEVDAVGLDDLGEGLCEADETDEQHPGTLTVGEELVEYICTPGDQDWYAFDIPAATPLVVYRLTTDVQFTTVTYRVALVSDAGGTVASAVDENGGRRPVNITGVAYAAAGGHRMMVENVDGIATDQENPYHLLVNLLADPDGSEPNDDPEQATPLAGCTEGYLAYLGDEDWFSFDVAEGQVVTVELRRGVEEAGISPVYEIRPEGQTEAVAGGVEGAAHALAAGAYRLRVHDDGDGSDLENAYEICVSMAAETDPFEGPGRNDTPTEETTGLGEQGCETGGRIGSLGDRDWYRVTPHEGTSPQSPSLFEARAQLEAPSERGIELALSLVKPHAESPCAVDEDCLLLRGACRGAWDCPSFVCDRAENKCAGAGVCLPQGVCGATVWSSTLDDFDADTTSLTVRAPLFDPVEHWLLVHDFQDDEWDETVPYQVCWQSLEEADPNEPNGAWSPYGREDGDAAGRSAATARALQGTAVRNDVTGEIESVRFACARGRISYPGDTDWFRMNFPNGVGEPSRTWHFEFAYTDSNSPLQLQYLLSGGSAGNLLLGWEEGASGRDIGGRVPGAGVWGRAECAYACHNQPRPFWLMVAESGARAQWDDDAEYEVCLTAFPGCRPNLCPCGPDRPIEQNQCPEPDAEAEGVDE